MSAPRETGPGAFVLASASASRRRLLEQAGLRPVIVVSGVDEEAIEDAMRDRAVPDVALALARAKAEAVAATAEVPAGALVLGCDSIFEAGGVRLGKPPTPEEAMARWQRMRGRSGTLHTGHWLIDTSSGESCGETVSTVVEMVDAPDEEIAAYIATGEPLTVAGGFTLDDLGAPYVAGVHGDPGNVIGVSLPAVRRLAAALGRPWPRVTGWT
ncbi:MAG: septum formation inhibitor Maf [Actinobacteria bacterium]|nr:septum formation inhibitor Maf [Actinomycetota bacterium]